MKPLDKKGISPLAATIFLIVFAIALGTVVMGLGKSYVQTIDSAAAEQASEFCMTITSTDPLAQLQIEYLSGNIDRSTYLMREKDVLASG